MPSVQETAYPRLKSNLTQKELDEIYTPTHEELQWMRKTARGDVAKLGLLMMLKTSQRVGYFMIITDVPEIITKHIARSAGITLASKEDLFTYNESGTCKRHRSHIRQFQNISMFNNKAHEVMLEAMNSAASTQDDPADLINVAVEQLIKHRFELPSFYTLNDAAKRVRSKTYRLLYEQVYQGLDRDSRKIIDSLFQTDSYSTFTPWQRVKQEPGPATAKHFRELMDHREWLSEKNVGKNALDGIPVMRLQQLAAEAKTLDAARMMEMKPKKRYTLAIVLVSNRCTQVVDDLGEMFVKRMMWIRKKGKEALKAYQDQQKKRTDELVGTLRNVLAAYQTEGDSEQKMKALQEAIGDQGDELLNVCEEHLAYAGENFRPFLYQYYKRYRAHLFRILRSVSLKSTSQDTLIEKAIDFLLKHQRSRSECIATVRTEKKGTWTKEEVPLIDLSWIPDAWWRWISTHRQRKPFPDQIYRRHFEVCVFMQIMWELKSGDLYIEGSQQYADYRTQLISWDEYDQKVDEFSEQVGLPIDGLTFVAQVQDEVEKTAQQTDYSFPNNELVRIENGEAIITHSKGKQEPTGLKALDSYINNHLEPINILDMLTDTEHWLNWTRFFTPISGHDTKLENPVERYLTTVFCYGCNLGPTQTARSLRTMDRRQIAWVNQRHITEENIEKAIEHIINSYNQFVLPKYWGTGKRAAADGTKWDIYESNLLSEYHVRYGGYGGIGYYHVSDKYIALFSRFIPCGVWEGIYILDILLNNSDIQPDTLHADTQGQNAPTFGLAYLLGIDLMPRIRNWKDYNLFRPDKASTYKHIDELFSKPINWDLIKMHYDDLLRVVMSIKEGRISPSTILNKLGTYSHKNRLYQAFRELGRAIRTKFLLQYMANEELRITINEATNKNESFNHFTKWLSFGGEGVIAENDREKQRKMIKFNHLIANCLIFYNVFALSWRIHKYTQRGNPFDEEAIAKLSPYKTSHINRFGRYQINVNRETPEIDFNLSIATY